MINLMCASHALAQPCQTINHSENMRAKKVSQEFSQMMLEQYLAIANKPITETDNSATVVNSMYNNALAKTISESNGFGLSNAIYNQIMINGNQNDQKQ